MSSPTLTGSAPAQPERAVYSVKEVAHLLGLEPRRHVRPDPRRHDPGHPHGRPVARAQDALPRLARRRRAGRRTAPAGAPGPATTPEKPTGRAGTDGTRRQDTGRKLPRELARRFRPAAGQDIPDEEGGEPVPRRGRVGRQQGSMWTPTPAGSASATLPRGGWRRATARTPPRRVTCRSCAPTSSRAGARPRWEGRPHRHAGMGHRAGRDARAGQRRQVPSSSPPP